MSEGLSINDKVLADPERSAGAISLGPLIAAGCTLTIERQQLALARMPTAIQLVFPLVLTTLAWSAILLAMALNYATVRGFVHWTLLILTTVAFAAGLCLVPGLVTALLLIRPFGFRRGLWFGFAASLSVVPIAVLGLALLSLSRYYRLVGFFPEHLLTLGGFLTVLSHMRVVALVSIARALAAALLLGLGLIWLLGPGVIVLFKL